MSSPDENSAEGTTSTLVIDGDDDTDDNESLQSLPSVEGNSCYG